MFQAVVRSRAGRGADAGGVRARLAQALELPRRERLLLLALPADGERGAPRAALAPPPRRADRRDRGPGEPGAGAAQRPRRRPASTSRRRWRRCRPGARAVFVLHDVEGRTHEEIARCWASRPEPRRRSCTAPAGCSGRHSRHDLPRARPSSRRLGRRRARGEAAREVESHLASCAACRERERQLRQLLAHAAALPRSRRAAARPVAGDRRADRARLALVGGVRGIPSPCAAAAAVVLALAALVLARLAPTSRAHR